jgi:dolichyl-phosphate-mannose-protein mannosyltransferase
VEVPWRGFERIKHGDIIRLEHMETKKRLHSHDHRPPVTDKKTHSEVSCYGDAENPKFIGDFNDHWRVEIMNAEEGNVTAYLQSMKSKFKLVHVNRGCSLFSHEIKLPKWAFKQQEVTCAGDGRKDLLLWRIERNEHADSNFFEC